ncbi:DAK2 domain-containing protein [Streptomyces sp. CA-111067]|uniref:DAK2 domain-containing protein n=1 Tax=Streptomyces sp. CA-111067 TaxID=3240046 RepID=UPI003D99B587
MPPSLDAPAVRAWCRLALQALGRAREEIDAINVYPVADGDTGTNLYLTVESAAQAVEAVFDAHGTSAAGGSRPTLPEAFRAMSHGALIGARGNSGTILAQLLRGMRDVLAADGNGLGDGPGDVSAAGLRRALRVAAESAYEAVARPVEGTMLSVATGAADAAEAVAGGLAEVARAAHSGAGAALAATPGQLAALRKAGVVDAGGLGLVAVLAALADAVTGDTPMGPLADARPPSTSSAERQAADTAARRSGAVSAGPEPTAGPSAGEPFRPASVRPSGAESAGPGGIAGPVPLGAPGDATSGPGPAGPPAAAPVTSEVLSAEGDFCPEDGADPDGPAFEVIFLLEGADAAVAPLRHRLDALGDSLVIVGGDGLWHVHVHVDDVGAAIEAGIEAGRPYRIRVTHFGQQTAGTDRSSQAPRGGAPGETAVVVLVRGEGLADLCAQAGALVVAVRPGEQPASGEIAAAIRRAGARQVVLLPNDAELRHAAGAAMEQARADGVRVALIPTRSAVQGLAALAVHEPSRRFDEDVVAMTSAAGATRYAELTVAEYESWTTVGICQAGDVLGLIDGDVAVIGGGLEATAATVLDRMLAAGGELVTLVLGADAPPDLAPRIESHVRDHHLAVDTVVYDGGQRFCRLLIGVE